MTDFNRFIDIIHSNRSDIRLNKNEINQQLRNMGIKQNYQIPIKELIGTLKENHTIKKFHDLHSMLRKYDHYHNGYASIYQIKKLFKSYDQFGEYQHIKQIIDKQRINRCGMINVWSMFCLS